MDKLADKRIGDPHCLAADDVLARLSVSRSGLTSTDADTRLETHGRNLLPRARPPGLAAVLLRQFASPLIYVLLAAAAFSAAIGEFSDAGFIFAVLVINAAIGATQEFSAQRAASALQRMVPAMARVLRDGDVYEIDAERLVPGDGVLLESGDRVPADLRLLTTHELHIDESPLTGESEAVGKDAAAVLAADTVIGDRINMAFAGTLVNRGRAHGVVVGTGADTELGGIAAEVLERAPPQAPLLQRMERFTKRIALGVGVASLVVAAIGLSRGMPATEILLLAVALAVSAIPEGLPVALTVALAIGMRRMARRHVVISRLVAVESLGSCTYIATDKTGTLTVNQLTARRLMLPDGASWELTGTGADPDGTIVGARGTLTPHEREQLQRLALAAVLPNDGFLARRDGNWVHRGDAVDVALLVMAHKAGVSRPEAENLYPEIASIPFESERLYAASLNRGPDGPTVFAKGALEHLLPMCERMAGIDGDVPLDVEALSQLGSALAREGYRVLALAAGAPDNPDVDRFGHDRLRGLTLLGLVGMIDPLRPEAKAAIADCRRAGIEVAMVTGDHPETAAAIGTELDLADSADAVMSGPTLNNAAADGVEEFDRRVARATVFARVEPRQKLAIVQSLQRSGHFVAVSGDGANDAPALRAAHVGVAMGRSGTDVARETADLIITDDNFSSIVAGIEEGRIAYANVRKVIFLLISTGAAELVLFSLALLTGQPLPLLAVQLLWLNLVTNGIQDVALAFEPGEGDELSRPPRDPRESIFNRIMIERVMVSAVVIGVVAFTLFQSLLAIGYDLDAARNGTLLLMVLFENVHVFNSRSESRSVFALSPLRNPLLLFGTLAAQGIHIGAMYTPWISDVLRIEPVSMGTWFELLLLAMTVLAAMEAHKWLRRRFSRPAPRA